MQLEILNIRSYFFSQISHLDEHRQLLADIGELLAVKGTVILSPEGINISIAGSKSNAEQMFEACKAIPGLEKIIPKKNWSAENPFEKLKIKIKDEIIRMDHPEIHPEKKRAPSIGPKILSKWLFQGCDDNGLPIKIVDTRNDFEVEMGAFKSSINWKLKKFSDFPKIFEEKKHEISNFRVITVCTGGIRCEKATLYMNENGISNAVQLDGGILNYLENTDGMDWNGKCFIFENRKFLDVDGMPNF
tara:strand:+ start:2338 stop:3075 length:738 start_codon:yes stop_codon:yes gene_type:complete